MIKRKILIRQKCWKTANIVKATYKWLVLPGTGPAALELVVSPQDFEPPDRHPSSLGAPMERSLSCFFFFYLNLPIFSKGFFFFPIEHLIQLKKKKNLIIQPPHMFV